MRRIIIAALAIGLAGGPAIAQLHSSTGTVADPIAATLPLALTPAQRQRVIAAVTKEDTLDKLPPDYQPAIGAKIPTQKQLAAHPLPRPLVYEVPQLKQYYYARLPDRVLIIDPMKREVAAILPM